MAKWLLVDGFNMAYRCFYAIPDLTREDGFPTGAIHGWLRTLWKLEDMEKPDHIVVFFDLGGSQDRLKLMPDYKANRTEMPEPLQKQIPQLKHLTKILGYPLIEQEGVEADDLMASAAYKLLNENHQVFFVSSDKDLAQCLQPGLTQLLPPPTANPRLGWRKLEALGVPQKFGVQPNQIVDYLALIGDASDNIPSIQGVGPKTAQKWIHEHGSIDTIIEKANYLMPKRFQCLVAEHADKLRLNVQMIQLKTDYPIIIEATQNNPEATLNFLQEMQMKIAEKDARKRLNLVSS